MRDKYELAHWTIDDKGQEVIDYNKYLPLMFHTIKRFSNRFIPRLDHDEMMEQLRSEADLAFTRAVNKYNLSRDIKFSTLLVHSIINQCKAYFKKLSIPRRSDKEVVSIHEVHEFELGHLHEYIKIKDTSEFAVMNRVMARLKREKPLWHKVMVERVMKEKTLQEVARLVRRTREHVRQVESSALIQLIKWGRELEPKRVAS